MVRVLHLTPLEVAENLSSLAVEVEGEAHNPFILAMLQADAEWPQTDETPWCKAAVNWVCRVCGIPYTPSLQARSALAMGEPVRDLENAEPGADLIILARDGPPPAPGLFPPGHVGFYVRHDAATVWIHGGNQSNAWNIAPYPRSRILGIRRLI